MKTPIRKVVVLLVAFVVLAAAPAMACGSHRFKAHYDGGTVAFNPDPVAVGERCPQGFEWILGSEGAVYIKTPVYRGEMKMVSEHCSRWLTPPGEKALGEIGGGLMTLTAGDNELLLTYEGYFKFKGDVETEWVSKVKAKLKVVGGTGVFEDASGRGVMFLTDETNVQTARLKGKLFFDR